MSGPGPWWVARAARAFGLAPLSIEPAGRGHIHDTFFVETDAGAFVLQRVNRTVFPDMSAPMANMRAVHDHLGGAMVPDPVATPDGGLLLEDAAGTWRAFARVVGAAPVQTPTVAVAGAAGAFLGRFHAGLAGMDLTAVTVTLPGFHDPGRRLEQLRRAVAADAAGRAVAVRQEIDMALSAAPLAALADELIHTLPHRVAHHDAKLDNFLFRGNEPVCLVDLDTLMPGAWLWDVGDLVRSAATLAAEDEPDPARVAVDEGLYAAVTRGYRAGVSTGAITGAELEAVDVAGALVTYEQGLRFLTDWLEGDRYYRTTRPGHNRDRARAQLHLLATMPGATSS